MASNSFEIEVPADSQGAVLKVTAPDGVVLKIPLPETVGAGDFLRMTKQEGGQGWACSGVSRGSSRLAAAEEPAGITMCSEQEVDADLASPETVVVQLQTTKGPILLKVVPSWAPLGAQRFLKMVDDGFYHEVSVYRAVDGFLAQFGLVKDPERTERYPKMQDDPLVGVPIQEGTVIFAAKGANTRTTQVCLFFGDCPSLGKSPWETPIGKVCPESMATLHTLFTGYGDIPQMQGHGPDPIKLEELGNDYLKAQFPNLDYVIGAARVKRRINAEWIECEDVQGTYFYSQRKHEALTLDQVSPEALALGHVQLFSQQPSRPSQVQQPAVRLQLGEWVVYAGAQGDFFHHTPSGQSFAQPPPEFLQLQERHQQMQSQVHHPAQPSQQMLSQTVRPQHSYQPLPAPQPPQPPHMVQQPLQFSQPQHLQHLQQPQQHAALQPQHRQQQWQQPLQLQQQQFAPPWQQGHTPALPFQGGAPQMLQLTGPAQHSSFSPPVAAGVRPPAMLSQPLPQLHTMTPCFGQRVSA